MKRLIIRDGKAVEFVYIGGGDIMRYEWECFDDNTTKPVDPGFVFNGRVWADPLGRRIVLLDDPAKTAWPRCVRLGGETPESREWRQGFDRGRYGLRAPAFRETTKRSAAWMDGYASGRSARISGG